MTFYELKAKIPKGPWQVAEVVIGGVAGTAHPIKRVEFVENQDGNGNLIIILRDEPLRIK